jgi:dolichol-phosphate mannosyltransferase
MFNYYIIFSVIFIIRIIFALNVNLIDDEAYHWSWSKNLMLSYYDHPGMIAWLNWISTSLFGDTIFAIRLPSFVFYSLSLLMYWKLAKDLFDEKVAFWVSMIMLWTPFWGFGGYVNSPEPVFIFCWLWGAWVFWQSIRPDEKKWSLKKTWLYLGLIMGLGLNSKFIIAMLAFGFGSFLLSSKDHRKMLLSKWPWIGFLIATIICLPVFLWNYQYDWPGFRYQFHGRHAGETLSMARWATWFTTQFLFYTPAVYILMLFSLGYSLLNLKDLRIKFLFLLALPSYLVFYTQPLFADYKPHWSGPASFFICIIAAHLYYQGWKFQDKWIIYPESRKWKISILAFLIPLNLFIYIPFIYPIYPKIYRALSSQPWNTKYDLSNEFFGWEAAGQQMLKRQREIHSETGEKPFLAAIRYETTAQSIWGTKENILMLNKFVSHYTVTQNKWHIMDKYIGSTALILTTEKYPDNPMEFAKFDSCKSEEFKFYRADEHSRTFYFWYCKNFQGINYK